MVDIRAEKHVPFRTKDLAQGLKPSWVVSFAARLKPCPDTKHERFGEF
jgi:hypothetical protein